MDAGIVNKPPSIPAAQAPQSVATPPVTSSDLSPDKTVTPIAKSNQSQNEPRQAETKSTAFAAYIDPQTNEVVYKIINAQTGQTVLQIPDQAALRTQAYARAQAARALANGKNPTSAALHVLDGLDTII